LQALPASLCSHSAQVADVTVFRGKQIVVLGAGASATDVAGLAQQAGASVTMVSHKAPIFHTHLLQSRGRSGSEITAPNLGLGPSFSVFALRCVARCFSTAAGGSASGHRQTAPGSVGRMVHSGFVVGKVAQVRGSIQRPAHAAKRSLLPFSRLTAQQPTFLSTT